MSEASIKKLHADFQAKVEAACREGRGEQLAHEFIAALAAEFADAVFLKMDTTVSQAEPDEAAALWDWVNDFPHRRGIDLLEGIAETFRSFGASQEQIQKAQTVAAEAFLRRLNSLFEACHGGGSA